MRVNRIIDGAGHWVEQETLRQVNSALMDFLSSLAG